MSATSPAKMPRNLQHQPDPVRPGFFRVIDRQGGIWADGVPNEAAARIFAGSPGLLLGYDWMMEEVLDYFYVRWSLGFSDPDFEDFVNDDGEMEERYPGAAVQAVWLQNLRDRLDAVKGVGEESPVEPYVDPQTELFSQRLRDEA